ncbi:hypothetical protein FI667_g4884, partial [Globisporangium splendens]
MTHQVEDYQKWRERLPRPDLYSLCQDGFDLGLRDGCEGYCKENVDESRLASLRLDACTFLRGTLPMDRMRACQSGFTAAVGRAKVIAVYQPPQAETTLDSVDSDAEAQQAATQANRKLNVKKIPEVRVRGLVL